MAFCPFTRILPENKQYFRVKAIYVNTQVHHPFPPLNVITVLFSLAVCEVVYNAILRCLHQFFFDAKACCAICVAGVNIYYKATQKVLLYKIIHQHNKKVHSNKYRDAS
jgi:hypothetical protein